MYSKVKNTARAAGQYTDEVCVMEEEFADARRRYKKLFNGCSIPCFGIEQKSLSWDSERVFFRMTPEFQRL